MNKCITCNEEKELIEFKIYSEGFGNIRDSRYERCNNCRNIEWEETKAEMGKIEEWVWPKTINSWPSYGSGGGSTVNPPGMYYEQMLDFIGILRKKYIAVKMANILYHKLRKLFDGPGMEKIPFPAIINNKGLAVWKPRMHDLSIVALYSLRYYITLKDRETRRSRRIENIERRPVINYKRGVLKEARKEALKMPSITQKIIKAIDNTKSIEALNKITKKFLGVRKTRKPKEKK